MSRLPHWPGDDVNLLAELGVWLACVLLLIIIMTVCTGG